MRSNQTLHTFQDHKSVARLTQNFVDKARAFIRIEESQVFTSIWQPDSCKLQQHVHYSLEQEQRKAQIYCHSLQQLIEQPDYCQQQRINSIKTVSREITHKISLYLFPFYQEGGFLTSVSLATAISLRLFHTVR